MDAFTCDSERRTEQRQRVEARQFAEQANSQSEIVHGGSDTQGEAIVSDAAIERNSPRRR